MNARSWGWRAARRRAASWGWRVIDQMAFAPTGRLINGLGQVAVLGLLGVAVGRRELRKLNAHTA